MSRSAGPAAAAVLAALVLGVAWSGLVVGTGGAHLAGLCALALLPAAASLAPRARPLAVAVALAASVPLVLALALRRPASALPGLDGDAWAAARRIVPDGLSQGAHGTLPATVADEPAFVALLDVSLALLVAAAAWQILVRRRPVVGLVVVAVGLAYRWTVDPPGSAAAAGGLALAALVAVLALAAWEGAGARPLHRLSGAIVLGALCVSAAAVLGAGPARAGEPWWAWKDWSLGTAAPGVTGLDPTQGYQSLRWPASPRVVARVRASVSLPLRAVALDAFDGISFGLDDGAPSTPLVAQRGALRVPPGEGPRGETVSERITISGTRTAVVPAPGRPVRLTGPFHGTADLVEGAVRLARPLGPGDSYTVTARVPRPTPAALRAIAGVAGAPAGQTSITPFLGGRPVDAPPWGEAGAAPSDAELGPYARVRALARRVAGDAASPYVAVNRIEAYLRGHYAYDERPPYPTSLSDGPPPAGDPPLVDFLLHSHRGFCQHFAGGMAVMLRSLGIPARVAVGYTGGRYDPKAGDWEVLDRDAHSWVEVWFPGHGWLPFDPTPGRSAPNPASVSSPDYAPGRIDIGLGGLAGAAVDPPARRGPRPPTPHPARPGRGAVAPPVARGGGGPDARWLLLLLLVPPLAAPGARAARRLRRRRTGDERERVLAAARELERELAPPGLAPPLAASAGERAAAIRARTGVDPGALYARAATARFAPSPPPPGEAAAAWRELTRLRRAIRRQAPRGRRLRAALGLHRRGRGTVGA